jgi:transcriptional regulator with XRE-family HTH domain
MAKDKYEKFLVSTRESLEYWTEVGILDFTEDLCALMDRNNVSRTKLANLIGNSPAYITKVLRGDVNFTLATMTKLAHALNAVVHVHLSPEGAIVHWKDEIESPKDVDFR